MTARCGGGTSAAMFGAASSVVVDQQYVQNLLPSGWAWLYPYLPWMQGLNIGNVGAFCSTDPPSWTTPGASAFYDLITGSLSSGAADVVAFMNAVVQNYIWNNLCVCTSGALPTTPAAPAAPANLPAVNPPGLASAPAGACATWTGNIPASAIVSTGIFQGIECDQTGFPTCGAGAHAIPAGATSFTATQVFGTTGTVGTGGSGDVFQVLYVFYDSSGTFISTQVGWGGPHGATHTDGPFAVPSSAARFETRYVPAGTGLVMSVALTITWYCGSQPNGNPQASACCTSFDPYTQSLLNQILTLVTLTQRNVAPFAYVPGAVHPVLSGDGTLTIPTCIGVRVTITTVPGYAGSILGSPNEIFDIGWYSWGDTTGYAAREVIYKNPQLSFPAGAAKFTRLGYSLNPGVVATIQELYAET